MKECAPATTGKHSQISGCAKRTKVGHFLLLIDRRGDCSCYKKNTEDNISALKSYSCQRQIHNTVFSWTSLRDATTLASQQDLISLFPHSPGWLKHFSLWNSWSRTDNRYLFGELKNTVRNTWCSKAFLKSLSIPDTKAKSNWADPKFPVFY